MPPNPSLDSMLSLDWWGNLKPETPVFHGEHIGKLQISGYDFESSDGTLGGAHRGVRFGGNRGKRLRNHHTSWENNGLEW